jgi:acyl carrier protein
MDYQIQEVFREVFDNDELKIDDITSPKTMPEWDSLAHVKIILGLEEAFDIQFLTREVAELKSVGALKEALLTKGIAA